MGEDDHNLLDLLQKKKPLKTVCEMYIFSRYKPAVSQRANMHLCPSISTSDAQLSNNVGM